MASAQKKYTRLTGYAASVGTYGSLWLGDDHLMLVTGTGYTEDYVRVRLRDVQGCFVVKTNRRLWWGLGWGALAGGFALVLWTVRATPGMAIFSGTMLAFMAIGVVWNHLLGPGGGAYVVTGVQTVKLPALVRLRKTRRVLARLQPFIDSAPADPSVTSPAPELREEPPPL